MVDGDREVFMEKIGEVINDHPEFECEILTEVMLELSESMYDTSELPALFEWATKEWIN